MSIVSVENVTGKRVYVVGDIHGCPEEPAMLLRFLEESEGLGQDDLVIFLGDYIDRGPDSKAVVDLMLDFKARYPGTRFLRGNHEDMMLDFLGFGGNLGQAFLYNGGIETIQSYSISVFAPPTEMVGALPPTHFKFFRDLESVLVMENFICVHAGVNPRQPISEQTDNHVYWIRDEFLNSPHNFGKTVIFGHTPHQELFVHLPYKLGIDTGLVFGNKLSCIELRSGAVFQVRRQQAEVEVSQIELVGLGQVSEI